MLVSTKVEQAQLFAGLRTIVVDEIHAFAGAIEAGTCWQCSNG